MSRGLLDPWREQLGDGLERLNSRLWYLQGRVTPDRHYAIAFIGGRLFGRKLIGAPQAHRIDLLLRRVPYAIREHFGWAR